MFPTIGYPIMGTITDPSVELSFRSDASCSSSWLLLLAILAIFVPLLSFCVHALRKMRTVRFLHMRVCVCVCV